MAIALYKAAGGDDARWLYLPENAQHVAGMIVMPIVEEVGWRGYALPRLQARHGALRAAVLLGIAWAAWHTMMFLLVLDAPLLFALALANVFVGSFWFSWLFNRTRQSLLIAVLAHVGVHWNNPSHALPHAVGPFAVYTVALAVAGLALFVFDRHAWTRAEPTGGHTHAGGA